MQEVTELDERSPGVFLTDGVNLAILHLQAPMRRRRASGEDFVGLPSAWVDDVVGKVDRARDGRRSGSWAVERSHWLSEHLDLGHHFRHRRARLGQRAETRSGGQRRASNRSAGWRSSTISAAAQTGLRKAKAPVGIAAAGR